MLVWAEGGRERHRETNRQRRERQGRENKFHKLRTNITLENPFLLRCFLLLLWLFGFSCGKVSKYICVILKQRFIFCGSLLQPLPLSCWGRGSAKNVVTVLVDEKEGKTLKHPFCDQNKA